MEDKMNSGIHHPNNFNCKTYWLYKDGSKERREEPEMKKAQYEIDMRDDGYGKKICIKIFSRVGKDAEHKRDFYTYLEFNLDSTFARSINEFLGENIK